MQQKRYGDEANDESTRPDQHRLDEHRIRLRAYEIWEEEGRPDGRAEDHWRMAKWQLEGAPDEVERLERELGHEDEPG
jgi:hypothetical protein